MILHRLVSAISVAVLVNGCVSVAPEIKPGAYSSLSLGQFVDTVARNVRCDIRDAVDYAIRRQGATFLTKWSAKITMTVSAEEEAKFNPGLSGAGSIANSLVTGIAVAVGATFSRNATRKIEVTWFEVFDDLLKSNADLLCRKARGVEIQGDLKIRETILSGVYPATEGSSLFNEFRDGAGPLETIQNTISFTTEIGGSITPTITFTNVVANPGGNTASADRKQMDQILITMGPGQIEATKRAFGRAVVRPSVQVDLAHQSGRIGLEFQNFQQRRFFP